MLRVGYPANLAPELQKLFPEGINLVPIPSKPDTEIAIDIWVCPPAASIGQRVWPYLRGVKTALSMMAGTEWLTELVGPTVTVCNAQGAHSISTAEWTIAAILSSLKYFPIYRDLQNDADWKNRSQASKNYAAIHRDDRPQFPPILQEELTGKKVLIVGYGDIGKTIERFLAPFDVEITRVARTARSSPLVRPVAALDVLLLEAEIVILILPLTPDSHGLIGPAQLARMQQGALLVNAARGPIVQTDALVEALNAGRIRVALDVTDPEPLPPEHPLWKCPNVLITPHVAGSTPQFSLRAVKVVAEELQQILNGQPLRNVVQHGKS